MSDKNKLAQAKQLLDAAFASIQHAQSILGELTGDTSIPSTGVDHAQKAQVAGSVSTSGEGARIIEGIFDGQNMVGPDGKQYSIPANYASKSKLVEGDLMKLTIDSTGSFIYKQIGPVDRDRRTGILTQDPETDEFVVLVEGKPFKVLLASVTYFKGEPGDEVVILVPTGKESEWAAVENIIKVLPGGAPSPEPAPKAGGPDPVIHDKTGMSDEAPPESGGDSESGATGSVTDPAVGTQEKNSSLDDSEVRENVALQSTPPTSTSAVENADSSVSLSSDPAAPQPVSDVDLPKSQIPDTGVPASQLSDTRHDPAHIPTTDNGPVAPVTPDVPAVSSQPGEQGLTHEALSNTDDIASQKSGDTLPEEDEFERI